MPNYILSNYYCSDDYDFSNIYFTDEEKRFLDARKYNNVIAYHDILVLTYYDVISNKYDAVDNVLKVIKELKLNIWSMFKNKLPRMAVDFSHAALLEKPEVFIRITEAGAPNRITKAFHTSSFIDVFFEENDFYAWSGNWLDICSDPLNFRALQILHLYVRFKHNSEQFKAEKVEMAVRVLWSSIPDPLLTRADIFRLFRPIYHEKINSMWQWYCSLMNYEEKSDKCPRSLKHLSRCIIRNRLGDNFKLPEGVDELTIPEHIRPYLLLKDFYKIE